MTTKYAALAETLRQAIARGDWPQGQQLPTELELCVNHSVSRHTVRDALRLLTDEGLIARKRGAGTVVMRTQPLAPFSQAWGGVADVMQYARDARLKVLSYGAPRDDDLAALELDPTQSWVCITGLRLRPEGGPPLALTRICVRADLMPERAVLEAWREALSELIAKSSDVHTVRIEQAISAVVLDRADSKHLKVRSGEPALRTIRRYLSADGHVFQASLSLHPGDRFAYRMVIER